MAPLLEAAGYDVFSLASADPDGLEFATSDPDAHVWVRRANLVTLRGIGAENARYLEAAGVTSVGELATSDPDVLTDALIQGGAPDVRPRRVGVWVRGAQGLR